MAGQEIPWLVLGTTCRASRQNPNIYGFVHNSYEFKMTLHTNDISLFNSEPKASVPEQMKSMDMFRGVSSYLINSTKSYLLSMRDNPSQRVFSLWLAILMVARHSLIFWFPRIFHSSGHHRYLSLTVHWWQPEDLKTGKALATWPQGEALLLPQKLQDHSAAGMEFGG